jgi:hypothetical protein
MRTIRSVSGKVLWPLLLMLALAACTQVNEDLELFAGGDPVVTMPDGSSGPLAGATLSGVVEIELPYRSKKITRTELHLNGLPGSGVELGVETDRPFTFTVDTTEVVDGGHDLIILAAAWGRRGERIRLSEVSVTVANSSASGPANEAPTVDAGPDLTVAVAMPVTVAGAVDDDGAPGPLDVGWSMISGPGTVSFAPSDAPSTEVSFSEVGAYTIRLTADDGDLQAHDDIDVTVVDRAGNQPPAVSVGNDHTVDIDDGTTVQAAIEDDGLPTGSVSILWSKASGPGTAHFEVRTVAATEVSFTAPGVYVLRVVVDDGEFSVSDELTVEVEEASGGDPPPPPPSPPGAGSTELRGNPGFSRSDLGPSARQWYDRLWAGIQSGSQYPNAAGDADRGDLYYLGRYVNVHVTTMLTAFRYTGDLALLDEMDEIMQIARSELADTNGDGYLNWRWLKDPNNGSWYGNDFHEMDETMTHAFVAAVAWAYQNNRDLSSPGGVPYGERADFWTDYLENHFEAKWRQRSGRSFPQMDFLNYYLLHPWTQYTRYFWYMYRLTGSSASLTEAERRADVVLANVRTISTPQGTGYVYPWGVLSEGNAYDDLMPIVYGQYVTQAVQDLVLDGFDGFTEAHMERFANGVTHRVITNGTTDYGKTVGGDSGIAGLPIGYHEGRKGGSYWSIWAYAPSLIAYDASGEIASNAASLHSSIESNDDAPRRIFLSAAGFVHHFLAGQ